MGLRTFPGPFLEQTLVGAPRGGSDEGPPGLRAEGGDGFYAAYFRDLDGNKLGKKQKVFSYPIGLKLPTNLEGNIRYSLVSG